MQSIKAGLPHRDRIKRPRKPCTEKEAVPGMLQRSQLSAGAPRDDKDTGQDEREPNLLAGREYLVQERCCEQRHHQRHHTRKKRAGMCCGSKQQARVGEKHRRCPAEHDSRQSDPAESVDCEAVPGYVGQQQNAGDAEAQSRDIPGCEAGPKPQARHNDPPRPDAHGGETAERPLEVLPRIAIA
jgi:hypothetical protein